MRKTAVFRNELFVLHDPGHGHYDSPDRLKQIYSTLDRSELKGIFMEPAFLPASQETIALNHALPYIDTVSRTAGKTFDILDHDTHTSKESYAAACLAAGAVTSGVDLLLTDEIDNGFALIRPPGHHAEKGRSMGFCIFNNVAIGAHHALNRYGLERIMIIDWDVHHGNGTQFSFYDSPKVLYCSPHQYPFYPGTGSLNETGTGDGEGFTVNIPLPGGVGDKEYAALFRDFIVPIGYKYKPQLILVSAGFDIYYADPIGSMQVTYKGFAYMMRLLVRLAEDVCGGKILLALEGGYNMKGLQEGIFAVLQELSGQKLDLGFPVTLEDEAVKELDSATVCLPAIVQAREVAKKYWRM